MSTPTPSVTFIGNYVNEVRDLLIASAVAGQHAIMLSAPGTGKTSMAVSLAKAMAGPATNGEEHWVLIRMDPSTPPEAIKGAYDPAALLQGQLKRVVTGTPYAPCCRVAVFDEWFRGNDVLFDASLDATDRLDRDPDQAPVVWGTANFVTTGNRVKALLDRIGLWCWLNPGVLDVKALTKASLQGRGRLQMPGPIPDWPAIEQARTAMLTSRAQDVVADFCATLAQEAEKEGLHVHPRRVDQWSQLLGRTAVFYTGSSDFSALPRQSTKTVRWAWPAPTYEEAQKWAQIATSLVDPLKAAIEATLVQAYDKFRAVAAITDPAARAGQAGELGQLLGNTQTSLAQFGHDDPQVKNAIQTLTNWFAAAVRGEQPVMPEDL